MKETRLYAVPLAVDIINGKYYTIVIEDEEHKDDVSLPYVNNDTSMDIDLQIKECILKYIKVNPEWLKINLFNKIRNENDRLEVFYYFSIPYDHLKIVDETKAALINFDILCINDPFLCNLKYFI